MIETDPYLVNHVWNENKRVKKWLKGHSSHITIAMSTRDKEMGKLWRSRGRKGGIN